jgi:hypothetical protein
MNTSPLRRDKRACYISLCMSTRALCLTPSTLETPCTSRTPPPDIKLPRDYARTLPLHKIEACLPLLSLGTSLYTSGHRQSTFEVEESFLFLHKEAQFLIRRIQGCYPAIARSPLISTWVMSLSHQESEITEGRGRCRSFWMRSMKRVGIIPTKLIP